MARTSKTIVEVTSDLTGASGDEQECALLIVRHHPVLTDEHPTAKFDVRLVEIAELLDEANWGVEVELRLPGGESRKIVVPKPVFDELAPDMDQKVRAAPALRGPRGSGS